MSSIVYSKNIYLLPSLININQQNSFIHKERQNKKNNKKNKIADIDKIFEWPQKSTHTSEFRLPCCCIKINWKQRNCTFIVDIF